MDVHNLNHADLSNVVETHVKVHFLVEKHILPDSVAFMCEFYALPATSESNQVLILRSACIWGKK